MRETRRKPQPGHRPAVCGHPTRGVERAEGVQQDAALRERAGRRHVEPAERGGLVDPRAREVKRQRRQVGFQHLRRGASRQGGVGALIPEPEAPAQGDAARAAPSLLGRRLRDPHRHKARHPASHVVARHPSQPRVDHHTDIRERHRGFRDRGREHHASPAAVASEHAILLLERQSAVQQEHLEVRREARLIERLPCALQFGDAGQEDEEVPIGERQRFAHGAGHARGEGAVGAVTAPSHFDREGAPLADDHVRVAEERGDGDGLERRRHHEEAQVGAHERPRLEREREPEVGGEVPFVELVEADRRDPVEGRIVL